eukprot:m.136026 g.136026  ORF g.136026 m.136026 type:complete len:708 (-) comp16017_c0_seq1:18-2141(-)
MSQPPHDTPPSSKVAKSEPTADDYRQRMASNNNPNVAASHYGRGNSVPRVAQPRSARPVSQTTSTAWEQASYSNHLGFAGHDLPLPQPALAPSFQQHRFQEPASQFASPEAAHPPAIPPGTPSPLRVAGQPGVYRRQAPTYEQVEEQQRLAKRAALHARFDCKVPGCGHKYATSGGIRYHMKKATHEGLSHSNESWAQYQEMMAKERAHAEKKFKAQAHGIVKKPRSKARPKTSKSKTSVTNSPTPYDRPASREPGQPRSSSRPGSRARSRANSGASLPPRRDSNRSNRSAGNISNPGLLSRQPSNWSLSSAGSSYSLTQVAPHEAGRYVEANPQERVHQQQIHFQQQLQYQQQLQDQRYQDQQLQDQRYQDQQHQDQQYQQQQLDQGQLPSDLPPLEAVLQPHDLDAVLDMSTELGNLDMMFDNSIDYGYSQDASQEEQLAYQIAQTTLASPGGYTGQAAVGSAGNGYSSMTSSTITSVQAQNLSGSSNPPTATMADQAATHRRLQALDHERSLLMQQLQESQQPVELDHASTQAHALSDIIDMSCLNPQQQADLASVSDSVSSYGAHHQASSGPPQALVRADSVVSMPAGIAHVQPGVLRQHRRSASLHALSRHSSDTSVRSIQSTVPPAGPLHHAANVSSQSLNHMEQAGLTASQHDLLGASNVHAMTQALDLVVDGLDLPDDDMVGSGLLLPAFEEDGPNSLV